MDRQALQTAIDGNNGIVTVDGVSLEHKKHFWIDARDMLKHSN
jgi:hypothetical protein